MLLAERWIHCPALDCPLLGKVPHAQPHPEWAYLLPHHSFCQVSATASVPIKCRPTGTQLLPNQNLPCKNMLGRCSSRYVQSRSILYAWINAKYCTTLWVVNPHPHMTMMTNHDGRNNWAGETPCDNNIIPKRVHHFSLNSRCASHASSKGPCQKLKTMFRIPQAAVHCPFPRVSWLQGARAAFITTCMQPKWAQIRPEVQNASPNQHFVKNALLPCAMLWCGVDVQVSDNTFTHKWGHGCVLDNRTVTCGQLPFHGTLRTVYHRIAPNDCHRVFKIFRYRTVHTVCHSKPLCLKAHLQTFVTVPFTARL